MDFETFRKELATQFIPATVKTPGNYGLKAYLVALLPKTDRTDLPDEIALVVYNSELNYHKMNAAPDGQAYQMKHWNLFTPKISFSLVPQPYLGSVPSNDARGVAYDVFGKPVDWRNGHTIFSFGVRKKNITPQLFLTRLNQNIGYIRTAYSDKGLRGYLILLTKDYEIAFMNWDNEETMHRLTESVLGKVIARDADDILDNSMSVPAKNFDGWIERGECQNVRYPKLRSRK